MMLGIFLTSCQMGACIGTWNQQRSAKHAGISPGEELFDMTEKVVTVGEVAFPFGPTWTGFIQVSLNKSWADEL